MKLSERIRQAIKELEEVEIRHFKNGTVYFVYDIGRHTETGEELLIYWNRSLDCGPMHIRPLHMVDDTVEHNGQQVPRFTVIEP
jgi:hypothetical protein